MLITLLTDFGIRDTFVGVMKGVFHGIAPEAVIVDLTHQIPPQDIEAGAFAFRDACRFFPRSTIHVAIVDPGVGSQRRAVAARIGDDTFICPISAELSTDATRSPRSPVIWQTACR